MPISFIPTPENPVADNPASEAPALSELRDFALDGLHHGTDLIRVQRVGVGLAKGARVVVEISTRGIGKISINCGTAKDLGTDAQITARDAKAFLDHLAGQQRSGVHGQHARPVRKPRGKVA